MNGVILPFELNVEMRMYHNKFYRQTSLYWFSLITFRSLHPQKKLGITGLLRC